jgi:hypothetical protein
MAAEKTGDPANDWEPISATATVHVMDNDTKIAAVNDTANVVAKSGATVAQATVTPTYTNIGTVGDHTIWGYDSKQFVHKDTNGDGSLDTYIEVESSVDGTPLNVTDTSLGNDDIYDAANDVELFGGGGSSSAPVVFAVTVGDDGYGVSKYYINGDLKPDLTFEYGRTYEFDLSGVPGEHPFVLSTTERGTPYATPVGDKLIIDVTSSTPDLYYYCDNHAGMGAEISSIPFGMPPIVDDMVGLMNSLYDTQDASDGSQDGVITDMDTLKVDLIDAAINGNGSVEGLSGLLGDIDINADLNGASAGTESIQSIVSQSIEDGMAEFASQTPGTTGNKTVDEIFKESIEESIEEIYSHIPEAFEGS